ncbi:MAG TPA: hypothetical protein VN306_12155 [Mycobacterium sp.]|nr:hypothetical protein [Mycobacterium sp.]
MVPSPWQSGGPITLASDTYFTLSAEDLSWLTSFNRQQNRLGVVIYI